MYAVGERVLFRIFNISREEIKKESWSKVIYIEMVRPDGTPVKQAKFPLTIQGAHGYFEIPGDLLTGNYYILAYTKWMRNFSTYDYACNPVTIINPYKSQLEGPCQIPERSDDTVKTESEAETIRTEGQASTRNLIICRTDKDFYNQREKVTVNISIPEVFNTSLAGCCLAVVRPEAADTIHNTALRPDESDPLKTGCIYFIPEKRGMTVSGEVISGTDQRSVSKASVRLSVLTDNPAFSEYRTGENGKFLFVLDDLTGSHDLYFTFKHQAEQSLDLKMDNDFSTGRVKLNYKPFILDDLQRKTAQEIMVNMQISKIYDAGIFRNAGQDSSFSRHISFYGKPANVIRLDDYIELPTLEEVFLELVPEVYPVIRRKKKELVIKNEYYGNASLPSDPLILVDYLPVNDLEKVLELPPSRIQRIEVINDLFLQGEFFYGGIISIFTRGNDLGGMALPENSTFISFQNFEEQDSIEFPEYSGKSVKSSNLPDYRNCLYWVPDIKFDRSGSGEVGFYTSDSSGEYIIYVRGVTKEGEKVDGRCRIRVE
jgi:hypothetical protein